jgi:cell wall-associated NlpC family hydrolase
MEGSLSHEPSRLNALQAMLLDPQIGEDGTLDLLPAYLHFIRKMVGCTAYSYLPIVQTSGTNDVVSGGRYSCAYFVLSVLQHFGLVEQWNTWMREVEPLLRAASWQEISLEEMLPGDIILYHMYDGNEHVAFYDGEDQAISTALSTIQQRWPKKRRDKAARVPRRHDVFYRNRVDGPRTIKSVWTHPALRQ